MAQRILQEIDAETGEIVKEAILSGDEDFFIKRGMDNLYKSGYYYNTFYIKSFPMKPYFRFFDKHKELFFVARVLAEYLMPDCGILRRINEPYKWRHLMQDLDVKKTTVYRWREKLLKYGIVGEIKIFGQKHIIMNPNLFGVGTRSIPEVGKYFMKEGTQIRGKKRKFGNIR